MSAAGELGLLAIVGAAAAFSLLLEPGKPGLIAAGVMLALWFVLSVLGLVLRHRERERV